MKFFTDENIAKSTVEFLRNSGFNVKDLKEEKKFGLEDKKVLQWAAKENRILISHDKDFISLVERQKKKTAVVVVRLLKQSPKETNKVLEKLLKYLKKDKLSGKLILLEENSLRIW